MQVNIALNEPVTMNKAPVGPDKAKWMNTMGKEIVTSRNDVWVLVELPEGRKTFGSKLVFAQAQC